ncbi:putative Golgi matrix protein [Phyllosticta citribraziliensis]|uniref:Golgi matrix protein n=1 Tax=Phyllosticta citribraziliensis TaxID=989973 RepID=A0ABR1M3X3_9PEZI
MYAVGLGRHSSSTSVSDLLKANMSPTQETAPSLPPAPTTPKSKKKKNKKKGAAPKPEHNATDIQVNGATSNAAGGDAEDAEADDDVESVHSLEKPSPDKKARPKTQANAQDHQADPDTRPQSNGSARTNTTSAAPPPSPPKQTPPPEISSTTMDADTTDRLDALAKERDTLREEVTQLRKSLETIQSKHESELADLQSQLTETQVGKEQAENQYKDLRGKVNTIKTQLGERMRADAEELERTRAQIEDLEEQNRREREEADALDEENKRLRKQKEEQDKEIEELRGRASLSQQNWIKERDELIRREAYAREEFETAKQAMQDWEVLAMEERSLRENLEDKVSELEEQVNGLKDALDRTVSDRDAQTSTVDGLQRALRDIQDARKKELREIVENSQTQLDSLRTQLQTAEDASRKAKEEQEKTQKELERALPFEKEVKEKNLLIGKLRHEAVILNDHLTKALRILRKGRPEDNVDRQIVTNHLLQFLALDRSDPKKFQVLQLIAALLGWNDEQREAAGLSRPGSTATAANSLRVPLSPFRRTPSTPSLNTDLLLAADTTSTSSAASHTSSAHAASAQANKESLAELWQNFLEQEALEGSSRGPSRRESATSDEKEKEARGLGISS